MLTSLVCWLLALSLWPSTGWTEFTRSDIEFFESKVRPLLVRHCYECHSGQANKLQAGLRLDSRSGVLRGGDSGAAAVPGEPGKSLLIESVQWQSLEMPPKRKLPADQIAILARWIELGLPWPEETSSPPESAGPRHYDWAALRRGHWALRPVQSPSIPKTKRMDWGKNQIDSFVLAGLEKAGMQPAPAADPPTIVRRLFLDLTGLPPTPKQMTQHVQSIRQDRDRAIRELVDQLLQSPHYGERWGRHWLDVARYSDGHGGFLDNTALPEAWRYRDWVVDALNRDLPFDQFVRLQIAGDLIDPPAGIVATGFFALGPTYRSDGGDPDSVAQAKGETLDDRVDTLSRGLLALTVSCARCHDHKFDPIPQQDYYSLAGVFNNTKIQQTPIRSPAAVKAFQDYQKAVRSLETRIKQQQQQLKKQKRQPTDEERLQLEQWNEELRILKRSAPAKPAAAHALAESGSGDMKVAIRGNLRNSGEVAPRRFLRVLAGEDSPRFQHGSGRQELAEAIVHPENPLTARVMVNRVWMHHFGHAIVRTPSNFGVLGEQPTHPLLLDWLAARLVHSGWSLKQLHRTILTSATYQMSSRFDSDNFARDGDNRLIWRMNPRRLDVEAWRDSLLAVTGELDRTRGGPPTDRIDSLRRTLYFKVSRNGDRFASDAFLRLFDFPLMRATVAKRPSSIVPQQYLFMMNSSFMQQRAKALAGRLASQGADDRERISRAYQLLFGRSPSEQEMLLGLEYLNSAQQVGEHSPWRQYAQVLLSSNEFMYVK